MTADPPHDRPTIPLDEAATPSAGGDRPLAVEFVHRLRFTSNALDPGNAALVEVLGAAGDEPSRVISFVDSGVARAWPGLERRLHDYARAHSRRLRLVGPLRVVPGGERVKNDWSAYESAVSAINEAGICRQSFVLVLGGGAVLDAIGYAAATAHRGVRLIRLPTTTLSQCDSGVGVKNGINAFGKKNFLGTFAVPWAVINDCQFLRSLQDRDYRAGFSEVVKVALLKDEALFRQVATCADRIVARDGRVAHGLIRWSAELHVKHIVDGGDPFELTTSRPLDFGHWSAHKLEQMTGFGLRHGEAVAIGVALDVVGSALLGSLPWPQADGILACLRNLGFDLYHEALEETDELLGGLDEFREHLGGELTVTLLRDIARPVEVNEMDGGLVRAAVEHLKGRALERVA